MLSGSTRPKMPMTVLSWALTLGAIGFMSGFLGPIYLNPGANQGPLLGVFFTGPISVIVGAVAGLVVSAFRLSQRQNRFLLLVASFAVAVVTLADCFPDPQYLGFVVDGEIRSCGAPNKLAPERIQW
jgi:hypothetical protein